jgi:hypothetical protein
MRNDPECASEIFGAMPDEDLPNLGGTCDVADRVFPRSGHVSVSFSDPL